ncbi:MAG: ribokinase [Bryobacteraceae bacterium]|nr:ribokinase [Bryobacterales bacterium]MCL4851785.1 ribokinase [Bryobacteraceae bacterium]
MKPTVCVVGSLNMDFVVKVDHLPAPGETVLGRDFQMFPGGKGANQACAAGKLGSPSVDVRMVGRVGYDAFADHLKASLSAAGVDVSYVHATRSQPTGIALIWVESAGQNSIVVAAGANNELAAPEVEAMRTAMRGARYVLFQLETPLDTVEAALKLAREEGAKTILDPAPAQPLSLDLLQLVDILTPNETEACILLGHAVGRVELNDVPVLANQLRSMGPQSVVLKLGEKGCYYDDGVKQIHSPGFPVKACDTTAAGDTFNGALAIALAEGQDIETALRFANCAAAISITRIGAQASIPSRIEVDRFPG